MMQRISVIFGGLCKSAPVSVAITILYYAMNAIAPALMATINATIFMGAALAIEDGQRTLLITGVFNFLALRLVMYALNYAYSVLVNTGIFEKGSMYFRIALRKKISRLPGISLERADIGDMKKRAEQTIEEDTLAMTFYQVLECLSAACAALSVTYVLYQYHAMLVFVALLTVLPYPVVRLYRGAAHVKVRNAQAKDIRLADYYWSLLSDKNSVKELRTFGCQQYIAKLWKTKNREVREGIWSEKKKDAEVSLVCDVIKLGGYLGALMIALALTYNGAIGVHVFGAVVVALKSMQDSAKLFLEAIGELPELLSLSDNYITFMALEEEARGDIKFDGMKSGIAANQAYFSYSERQAYALKGINVAIHKGEHVAIVGENGSGKTTLVKLLLGIYEPPAGQVKWDGVPVEKIDKAQLHRHISIVSQDFVKYCLSLRENVGISDTESMWDDSRIRRSMAEAGFLEEAPLDEQLGMEFGGKDMSVGQWQKLAIARGIFRDAEFIALDEPTSALDAYTEQQVLEDFLKLMKGKTAVIVSHRMGICAKTDRIIVMKGGEVAECGSHDELMALDGEYARLYRAQADWY